MGKSRIRDILAVRLFSAPEPDGDGGGCNSPALEPEGCIFFCPHRGKYKVG